MAKQAKYDFSKGSRQKEIEKCQNCNGAPEPENFELQGMCGQFCSKKIDGSTCMNIINWSRVGTPITIRQKERLISTDISGVPRVVTVGTELTPGIGTQITFGDLKIVE